MGDRPRIALFSPVNPVRSGISDYTENLLNRLSGEYCFDLFLDGYQPVSETVRSSCRWYHFREFEYLNRLRKYDQLIYQIGNSGYHKYMYHILFRHPGIVFLHDLNLHRSRAFGHLENGKVGDYINEMEYCHGKDGVRAAWLVARGFDGDLIYDRFPMFRLCCEAGSVILVHNDYSRKTILDLLPEKPVEKIPAHFGDLECPSRESARNKLGMAADPLVIASMGFIGPGKGLELALRAFLRYADHHATAKYYLVGDSLDKDYFEKVIQPLVDTSNGQIICTGFVSRDMFSNYLAASDFCVNLRYPTQGESSSALLNIMAAGKPVIVPWYRQFQEFPRDVCLHVDLHPDQETALYEAYIELSSSPESRDDIGTRAQKYVKENHSCTQWVNAIRGLMERYMAHPVSTPPFASRCPLPHVKTLSLPEHLAIPLNGWQHLLDNDFMLNHLIQQSEEMGLLCD